MTEREIGLVLDCSDPDLLAAFWTGALGLERRGDAGNYVLLAPTGGTVPKLLLQRVSEPKAGKNRMHIDIGTTDLDGEVARLELLGAKRTEGESRFEHDCRWVVMADPEGNEFCVCDWGLNAGC
jgi:predicted enzyme related to lactoylglutathione lyase